MKIEQLIEKGDATAQLVRAALNILMESPYFYKEDDERAFLTVLRYRQTFAAFFEKFFGDWLEYSAARFRELFAAKRDAYSDEKVRLVLRGIMPALERYRFLRKVRPSADESVNESETIYEALPAMWHYQAAQLAVPIAAADEKGGLGCFGQD